MEGKRFVAGLLGGLLVALALVTASGGLGSTPFTVFNAARLGGVAATTTAASSTTTLSTTLAPTQTMTMTVTSTTTSAAIPVGSLNSSVTSPSSSSTTTFGTEATTTSTTSPPWSPANQSAATSANNAVTYIMGLPVATKSSPRLDSIAQQPLVSNAEIFAPVLVAFLLGAFLYRVAVQERQRSEGENPE